MRTEFGYWHIIYQQLFFSAVLKLVKDSMLSLVANQGRIYSEKVFATYGPHKPSGLLNELIEKSKKEDNKIFYGKREENDPFFVKNGRLFAFYSKKIKEIDHESKAVSLIIFTGFIPSLFTNLILPRFNIYEYEWLVSITIPVSILLIVYYIAKKNIFKIKVENYEFIIYLLIIFCFSLLIKNNNSNAIIDKIVLFIVVASLSLITTRNMTNIKHQSEYIEKVTKDMLSS
jgi:hypothetical protein